jgi:CxxC motif-containing protein (DUF1111 family)
MNISKLHRKRIGAKTLTQIVACASFLVLVSGMLTAQTTSPGTGIAASTTCTTISDPGPQPDILVPIPGTGLIGPGADAGGNAGFLQTTSATVPAPGLNGAETTFWFAALARFETVFSVSGTIAGEPGVGLGPAFNGNSCAMCHSQPAIGGTSPGLASLQTANGSLGIPGPEQNPQFTPFNTLDGATNIVPSFITAAGPVSEARFILTPSGSADGSVHELYTIKGRSDAGTCKLAQPDFATQVPGFNVITRIPTPLFGLGLVENVAEQDLQNNLGANATAKSALGIAGKFNTSGNDATITRFGWKAQNKSLLIFSGEAENVEMGITNELFPNEKFPNRFPNEQPSVSIASCDLNPTPEDITNGVTGAPPTGPSGDAASDISSDSINFAGFIRLNAPPLPITASNTLQTPPAILNNGATAAQIAAGKALFNSTSVGCFLCHTPSMTTQASPIAALSDVTFNPFSDFALHHMGSTLADGVTQGQAGPDEFRTAPLWGLAQRLFFLHDGRTSNLLTAIEDHFSNPSDCVDGVTTQQFQVIFNVEGIVEVDFDPSSTDQFCGSEANASINVFNALTCAQQQEILDYLRTL